MALLNGRGGREILEVEAAPLLVWSAGEGDEECPGSAPQLSEANRLESIWLSPQAQACFPPRGVNAIGRWLSP